ncbi:MAG TPA: (5-formylfuran-3-yl)methyl phosphate synthase [Vicinamibacterales bacterium]|nr:(5-formylfuran-3-yl)methyl phosphate synthase [Vicinamibacterales bacterium]
MRLLVSVSNSAEALAAMSGGADIIDAKDPLAGPLGPVSSARFCEIAEAIGGARPVTAALGDATDGIAIESAARATVAAGAVLVKVGFSGVSAVARATSLLEAAVSGAKEGGRERVDRSPLGQAGVVAVAYADHHRATSLAPASLTAAAVRAGVRGMLLDTFDKSGPGLRQLMSFEELSDWVANAHRSGLLVAVAGRLTADDLFWVRSSGADVAGVRGAACDGGRTAPIAQNRVQALRRLCGAQT